MDAFIAITLGIGALLIWVPIFILIILNAKR